AGSAATASTQTGQTVVSRSVRSHDPLLTPISPDSGGFKPVSAARPLKKRTESTRQQIECSCRAQAFAAAIGPFLDLVLARRDALRTDHHLAGHPDQVGSGEFRARALVDVVIEHVDALPGQVAVEALASAICRAVALLEVEDRHLERRHRLRPF